MKLQKLKEQYSTGLSMGSSSEKVTETSQQSLESLRAKLAFTSTPGPSSVTAAEQASNEDQKKASVENLRDRLARIKQSQGPSS